MPTAKIDPNEARKLPYLESPIGDERDTPLLPYFDSGAREWVLYVESPPGQLQRMRCEGVELGSYLARTVEDPIGDFELGLGTLTVDHISFHEVMHELFAFESDVHHCAAVLEKYHMISRERGRGAHRAAALAATELEYLVMLVRSMYDVLQGFVGKIVVRMRRADEPDKRVFQQPRSSFAHIALDDRMPRSAETIEEKFGLPRPLAQWYAEAAPFFLAVRKLRNDVEHFGQRPPPIFSGEEGLGVSVDDRVWEPWRSVWPDDVLRPNRIGPLRMLFRHIIREVLAVSERLALRLPEVVTLPPALMRADVRYVMRDPFGQHILSLSDPMAAVWEGAGDGPTIAPGGSNSAGVMAQIGAVTAWLSTFLPRCR